MKPAGFLVLVAACASAALLSWPFVSAEEPNLTPAEAARQARLERKARELDEARVPLSIARDRAKTMHDIYVATLDVMHHRYFHANRSVVPARALEDVFSHIKHQSRMEAHWIAVNLPAMSVDNEPETEFEKRAALELGTETSSIETTENGYYRRAGVIPLTSGCISCHNGLKPTTTPKFAGLVISIPITADAGPDSPAESDTSR